ncbi:MAG: adenylosuccinate lyase family protein, partial [Deltaproteobacteria bacterium]|nr:adenylosuccinate lyase family protein [Deltaproteobacteria bacterium]
PLLHGVQHLCEKDYGQYIHYGPTTQDIEDTGEILELKDVYPLILRDLREVEKTLMDLARRYQETIMCGRTHSQQALPITLGLKFAIWLSEIRRHIERWKEMKPRLLVGLLHGGAGTMAALGPKARETVQMVMEELGLGVPDTGWGNSRDHLAEYVCVVANAAATFGKIANEIFELSKTEIGELSEPFREGYIGSSTMPHKRNPEISEQVVMLSRIIRSHAGVALEAVVCEHERDSRSWRTDWLTLPECSMMMGAILSMMKHLLGNLIVHEDRIGKNLNLLHGLLFSEGFMFLLGEKIGKQKAHEVINKASSRVYQEQRPIKDILLEMPEVAEFLSKKELEEIMDYRKHIGFSRQMVEKSCATSEKKRKEDDPYLRF